MAARALHAIVVIPSTEFAAVPMFKIRVPNHPTMSTPYIKPTLQLRISNVETYLILEFKRCPNCNTAI